MYYSDTVKKIPAFAISIADADYLSEKLKLNNNIKIFLRSNCEEYLEKFSYNVIGEIKGSEYTDEIILVNGHLDVWDNGEVAHDDGAGVVHSYKVMRIFKN